MKKARRDLRGAQRIGSAESEALLSTQRRMSRVSAQECMSTNNSPTRRGVFITDVGNGRRECVDGMRRQATPSWASNTRAKACFLQMAPRLQRNNGLPATAVTNSVSSTDVTIIESNAFRSTAGTSGRTTESRSSIFQACRSPGGVPKARRPWVGPRGPLYGGDRYPGRSSREAADETSRDRLRRRGITISSSSETGRNTAQGNSQLRLAIVRHCAKASLLRAVRPSRLGAPHQRR